MRTPLTCLLFVCLCSAALAGCNLPRVHKVTVQQGNVITQEMIDKLKPGMTRSQVAFIMGEPIFRNSFDDDRWDYVYTLEVPGYYQEEKKVSLYFDRDVLAYFTGDYAPSKATAGARAEADQSATASTPAASEEAPTES